MGGSCIGAGVVDGMLELEVWLVNVVVGWWVPFMLVGLVVVLVGLVVYCLP